MQLLGAQDAHRGRAHLQSHGHSSWQDRCIRKESVFHSDPKIPDDSAGLKGFIQCANEIRPFFMGDRQSSGLFTQSQSDVMKHDASRESEVAIILQSAEATRTQGLEQSLERALICGFQAEHG